ncbi:radical SAM protein [Brassicibacter mesophilus]|uniref:radical SAM protein n=1 Tax=Brassicibacter mesophilus TaxID=745119 RepID=UPI003D23DC71
MYPYILKDSVLHYFDTHGILFTRTGKYILNDVDIYIIDKVDGKTSVDDIAKQIAIELDTGDIEGVKNIVMKCINSKPKGLSLTTSPVIQSCIKSGIKGKKVPLELIVSLTNRCNLKCMHCFKSCNIQQNDSIDYNTLIKALDFLKQKSLSLQLTGGEPMLHENFFDILRYSIKNFETTITTTGTMINAENIKYFEGIKCIQMSVYSNDPNIHDTITNTKGSFNKTMNGIEQAIKHGISAVIACLVIKDNISKIEDLIKLAIDQGIKSIRFGIFIPSGRGADLKSAWCLSKQELKEATLKLYSLSEKYKNKIRVGTWDEEKRKADIDKRYKCLSCGGGLYRWFISEKGSIKPCEFIPDEIYTIDNILEKSIDRILTEYNFEQLPKNLQNWDKYLKEEKCSLEDICPLMSEYCLEHCV